MKDKFKLKCSECETILEPYVYFDGCDWESEAGDGSGYKWCVSLKCPCCGSIYPIARMREFNDISLTKKKEAPYNTERTYEKTITARDALNCDVNVADYFIGCDKCLLKKNGCCEGAPYLYRPCKDDRMEELTVGRYLKMAKGMKGKPKEKGNRIAIMWQDEMENR